MTMKMSGLMIILAKPFDHLIRKDLYHISQGKINVRIITFKDLENSDFLIMKEKNLIYTDQKDVNDHPKFTKRKFLIGTNLTMTDVWRSRFEGKRCICDF